MPRQKRSAGQMKLATEVGGRLREIREESHLSQDELVASLTLGTRRSIGDYEAGKVLIPVELALRLCEKLDVSFDWLMSGWGPKKRSQFVREAESNGAKEQAHRVHRAVEVIAEEFLHEHRIRARPSSSRAASIAVLGALWVALENFKRDFTPERCAECVAGLVGDLVMMPLVILDIDTRLMSKGEVDGELLKKIVEIAKKMRIQFEPGVLESDGRTGPEVGI